MVVVVNTGDDENFFGLHVSPDIDTVTYTLAGVVNRAQGWGLENETFTVLGSLARFYGKPWFGLGDRDLATHIYRTHRMQQGAGLGQITSEIAKAHKVRASILPMTNDRVRTFVKLRGRDALPFQEYFVKGRARGAIERIELRGATSAHPLPEVLRAICISSVVILAPSNPFVSLGPILALRGVREALRQVRSRVIAITPIVGGRTIKGPADKMLRGLGMEVSPLGVARLYHDIAGTFVLDKVDADYSDRIRKLGMRPIVGDTVMSTPAKAARLARLVLDAAPV